MAYSSSEEESPESSETPKQKKTGKKGKQPQFTDAQWWRAAERGRKPHEILGNLAKQIEDDQSSRYDSLKEYQKLFSNGTASYSSEPDEMTTAFSDKLTQNELANTIETLWAQVFKNKIIPAVSTSNADYDTWARARDYSRWLEGAFDASQVQEEVFPQAGIHCLVLGTGIIKVGFKEIEESTAQITATAVSARQLFVDRLEARYGCPRTLVQKTHMDRYVLWEMYSGHDTEFCGSPAERLRGIETCTEYDDRNVKSSNRCDMIVVREAWHLPSSPTAKDGRHCIFLNNVTLVDEVWDWDVFPFVFIRFGCRVDGFWGESAVKRLAPTQKLLDKLNQKIDESQDVMGVPRILCQAGNLPTKEEIDDVPGGILTVKNINGIRDWNAQCASPEMYQDRDAAPSKMRSLLGVSDFQVEQALPQNTREFSAPAMERMVDQGQARHAMLHREVEKAACQLADLFMRQAESCKEMGYDIVVHAPDDDHSPNSLEELSFKQVHVDRKRLKVRIQPMNQLPQSFAGKVDAIAKLKNDAGIPLNPKTALRMMEIPDPGTAADFLGSDEEIIMKNLTFMCKEGSYLPPMPFDNLDLIVQLTTAFINYYRRKPNVDWRKVGMLAQYIDDAIALKEGLGGTDPNAPMPPTTMDALGMAPSPVAPPPMPGMEGPLPPVPPPGMGPPPMGPPAPPGLPPAPPSGAPMMGGPAPGM